MCDTKHKYTQKMHANYGKLTKGDCSWAMQDVREGIFEY